MEVFLQALVNGILLGGFYSLMGMGQNIIFGVMNIVNFCHGEMLMVGMYITYVLYTYFGVDPYVALPIVAVLMFGLGALIQSTLITPSLKTKSFTNLLFLTVGLGLLLTNGALVIFGSTYYKIITSYAQTYIPLGPVTIALPRLISFLILIVVALFGSGMGNANSHTNTNLPVVLAGGGLRHGRMLAFDQKSQHRPPLTNLFVSMLQNFGAETDKFANSTGTLRGLS